MLVLINLDKSPDRLDRMRQRLEAVGLPWQRIAAIDGRAMDYEAHPDLDRAGFEKYHGKRVSAGEVGCYLSHLQALSTFLASGGEFAVILEDDVVFEAGFAELLERLLERSDAWDMVKLSGFHSGTPLPLVSLNDDYTLAVPLSRHTGAGAYLVNRRAAQRLVDSLLPMRLPYDHAFDRSWELDFRMRLVTPLPVNQMPGDASSTIGYKDTKQRKFAWYRRLPMVGYRVINELRRFSHGLTEWLSDRRKMAKG